MNPKLFPPLANEEDGMGTKKLDERCKRIFDFFCQLDSEGNYCKEVPIVNLIFPNSLLFTAGEERGEL